MITYLVTSDCKNSEKTLANLVGWIFVVWLSSIYLPPLLLATKDLFCFGGASEAASRMGLGLGCVTQDEPTSTSSTCLSHGFDAAQNRQSGEGKQIWGFVWARRKLDFPFAGLNEEDDGTKAAPAILWTCGAQKGGNRGSRVRKYTAQSTPTEKVSWKTHLMISLLATPNCKGGLAHCPLE